MMSCSASSDALKQKRFLEKVAFFVGCCLAARFGSTFLTDSLVAQEIPFLALGVPCLMIFQRKQALDKRAFFKTFAFALPFACALVLSFLFNLDKQAEMLGASVALCNIFLLFVFSSLFACTRNEAFWRRILIYTALLSFPFFLYVLATQQDAYIWGRWGPYEKQPNWWGMMGLGISWCALAWKAIPPRVVFLGMGIVFMYLAQARGSIVALVPLLLFGSGYFFPLTAKKTVKAVGLLLLAFIILLGISFILSYDVFGKASDFLLNDVMRVNDPNRGLESGLSGRSGGYAQALNAFLENPFFGAGFAGFSFVHNGFLLTLAESGIFAFLGLLLLFANGLHGFWRTNNGLGFGIVLSYTVLLMTYPRTINLNMTSLLFVIVLMRGIAIRYIRFASHPPPSKSEAK